MLIDQYKGISDFCWVYRVSRIRTLRSIAYHIITKILKNNSGENRLVKAFLMSECSSECRDRFLGPTKNLASVFRDVMVLKSAMKDEKGVLLLKYAAKFDLFISLFDLDRIMNDYYIVLEPCWAGYCDTSILMFISSKSEVVIQCPESEDFDFIHGLQSNLIPIKLGSSDWVDADLFSEDVRDTSKEYDLVMVANWGRHKNHRRLFQALPYVKHKPLSVLLIGFDIGGRTQKDIVAEMQQYDLQNITIELKQDLPASKVAGLLKRSKCFILLSEKEGSNKAIVEALFSNVPAIVYDQFVGGAISKVNGQTGILTSYNDLAAKIDYMIDNYQMFTPRAWALQHSGSRNATRAINQLLKNIAQSKGEKWSADIVEKVNNPNLAYKLKDSILSEKQAIAIAPLFYR
jgi:glycosyltransferase involved in cell wall biosynthesis